MKYYSTNKQSAFVNFRDATIQGQAPDKGLYFPETIPAWTPEWMSSWDKLSREEIAFHVIKPYTEETIPEDVLMRIVTETVNFPQPLVKLDENIFALELFHGPTLAFKDTGARFMSRCLGYFLRHESKKVTVLVATSGDTGGAVADGFFGVEGVEVVILYPSGKVSPVQEQQLTTHGKNIQALEVQGNFDDCQAMVKQAFQDEDIRAKRMLSSANSINVARWLPQQFYYCFAWQQWPDKSNPPVVSVPSGNFGNICAGMMAMQSGLPLKHFIAACNVNAPVTEYLKTGTLEPVQVIPTLSNAMDVGIPSNFVRILEIFNHEFPLLSSRLSSASISDAITLQTITDIYKRYQYTADPHGAVGFRVLEDYLAMHTGEKGIFLETAHPVKFPSAVEQGTGLAVPVPVSVQSIMDKKKSSIIMAPVYKDLKEYLLNY